MYLQRNIHICADIVSVSASLDRTGENGHVEFNISILCIPLNFCLDPKRNVVNAVAIYANALSKFEQIMASPHCFRKTNFSKAQCKLKLDLFLVEGWDGSKFKVVEWVWFLSLVNYCLKETWMLTLSYFRTR